MNEQVPSNERTAEPQFMRAYAFYLRKPVREHGLSQSYLDSLADELEAAANEIEQGRNAPELRRWKIEPALFDGVDFKVSESGEWVRWEDVRPYLRTAHEPCALSNDVRRRLHGWSMWSSPNEPDAERRADVRALLAHLGLLEQQLTRAAQPPSGDESTLDITCPECSHQFFARAAEPAGEIVAEVHSDTLRWLVDDDHPVRTCGHAYLWSRPTKGEG